MDSRKLIVFCVFLFVMIPSALVLSHDIQPVIKYSGDINSDGSVDSGDLSIFSGQWLQSAGDPNADIAPDGGDGIVNFLDFSILAKDWLQSSALSAAQSGIECAKYLAMTVPGLPSANTNIITTAQADTVWTAVCTYIQNQQPGGQIVPDATRFTDSSGNRGDELTTGPIACGMGNVSFVLRFSRYDSDPNNIQLESIGTAGQASRIITVDMKIQRAASVLNYAIAGRGRIWITGDTTIHGSIYSSWNRTEISPFNLTADSAVAGTFNTVLTRQQIEDANYYRLDSTDQLLGAYDGVNYGVPDSSHIPGLRITDYDTSSYKVMANYTQIATVTDSLIFNGKIPTTGYPTVSEYYPHMAGSYTQPVSGSRTLNRRKYENLTLRNVFVSNNTNALFKNCTFEEVLYIDCNTNGSTNYNNVRFENCTFNGVIVTNTPQSLTSGWWQKNCLYFTGTETFHNTSSIPEATILAPHFNVNLGNTNPTQSETNILTGAIVGGIVDIRGNAQIYGTVVSMADTSSYTSGYVTNIGATEQDGGSETTEAGDIGTVEITPTPDQMLPSGIMAYVILVPVEE